MIYHFNASPITCRIRFDDDLFSKKLKQNSVPGLTPVSLQCTIKHYTLANVKHIFIY